MALPKVGPTVRGDGLNKRSNPRSGLGGLESEAKAAGGEISGAGPGRNGGIPEARAEAARIFRCFASRPKGVKWICAGRSEMNNDPK